MSVFAYCKVNSLKKEIITMKKKELVKTDKATIVIHEVRKEESDLKDLVKSDSELFPSENGE